MPRADSEAIQPKEGLTVSVDREGTVYLDDDPLTYQEFRATFPAIVERQDPNGVYFRGDGRASWSNIARVIAVIRSAGIEDLGLVTEPEVIER